MLVRLYAGMNSSSYLAERNVSVPNRTVDKFRTDMAVDKVEQLMLLKLNKRKSAVTCDVRETAAEDTTPGAVGASDSSTNPTRTAASSDP